MMPLLLRLNTTPAATAATPTDAVTMPATRRPDPPWVGAGCGSGCAAIDVDDSGADGGSGGAAGVGGGVGGTNGWGADTWDLLDWSGGSRSLQSEMCFSAEARSAASSFADRKSTRLNSSH